MPKRVPVEKQEALVAAYAAGASSLELAIQEGVSQTTMAENLRRWTGGSLRRTGPRRRYSLDEAYFSVIDTEEKAYWLGFMLADGAVVETGAGNMTACLELQIGDTGHLEKFKQAVNYSGPVRTRIRASDGREYARVVLCSSAICGDLSRLQCFQNKTCQHDFPSIPVHLERHMFRGYFDGDGCICRSAGWSFTIVGAPKAVDTYRKWLTAAGVNSVVQVKSVGRASSFTLAGGAQVEQVMTLLYAGATVFLDRKYELYQCLLARDSTPGGAAPRPFVPHPWSTRTARAARLTKDSPLP